MTRYWILGVEEVQGHNYLRPLATTECGEKARAVAEFLGKNGTFKRIVLVRVEEVY